MSHWFHRLSIAAAALLFAGTQSWANSYATGCMHRTCVPVICDNRGDNCTTTSGAAFNGTIHFPVSWHDSRYGSGDFDTANRFGTPQFDTQWSQGGLGLDRRSDNSYDTQSQDGGRW